jgi:hypothetical protein
MPMPVSVLKSQIVLALLVLKLKILQGNVFILGCTSIPFGCPRQMLILTMALTKPGIIILRLVPALISLQLIKLYADLEYAHGFPTLT